MREARRWRLFAGALLVASLFWLDGSAQPPAAGDAAAAAVRPSLVAVSPAAVAPGEVTVTLLGGDLADADGLVFSEPRVTARRIAAEVLPRTLPAKNVKKGMKAPVPPPATAVRFAVSVPADLVTAAIDVWAVTPAGLSNPRTLIVAPRPELAEVEPNDAPDSATPVAMPAAAHGAIASPTDVDFYRFAGRAGERVTVVCQSKRLDGRLVPMIALIGPDGEPLAAAQSGDGEDCAIHAALPVDGTYAVRVAQFGYVSGGADHFYRLTVGTGPRLEAVYPPVIAASGETEITLVGRNLPGGKTPAGDVLERAGASVRPPASYAPGTWRSSLPFAPASAYLDGLDYRLYTPEGLSEPAFVGVTADPIVLDSDVNDTPEAAQRLPVPCEAVGRIDRRGDADTYSFEAGPQNPVVLELLGDRIGGAADLFFTLARADGRPVQEADDSPDTLSPNSFFGRTDDPARVRFAPPDAGTYTVRVSSREAALTADRRDAYRLRLAPERPDFRVVVMPSAPLSAEGPTLGRGESLPLLVHAFRLDGFDGPITLTAEGLPQGVTCVAQQVPEGARWATLTLTAAADAPDWAGTFRVTATADTAGKRVTRVARSASIVWGVPASQFLNLNTPMEARLQRALALAVRGPSPVRLTHAVAGPGTLYPGDSLTVPLTVTLPPGLALLGDRVNVQAVNLPPGVVLRAANNQTLTLPVAAGKTSVKVDAVLEVRQGALPGQYAAVFRAYGEALKSKTVPRPAVFGVAPPVAFEIPPRETLRVEVTTPALRLKAGESGDAVLNVTRLARFRGPVRVEAVFDGAARRFLSADPVALAANEPTATLVLKVRPDAKPGTSANVKIRLTPAGRDVKAVAQEVSVGVTVVK